MFSLGNNRQVVDDLSHKSGGDTSLPIYLIDIKDHHLVPPLSIAPTCTESQVDRFGKPFKVVSYSSSNLISRNPTFDLLSQNPQITALEPLQKQLRTDVFPRSRGSQEREKIIKDLEMKPNNIIQNAMFLLKEQIRCLRCYGSVFEQGSRHDDLKTNKLRKFWAKLNGYMLDPKPATGTQFQLDDLKDGFEGFRGLYIKTCFDDCTS